MGNGERKLKFLPHGLRGGKIVTASEDVPRYDDVHNHVVRSGRGTGCATDMNLIIFRQDREHEESRNALFAELRKGRLRQGWSYSKEFDLHVGKKEWIRRYKADRRSRHGKGTPKSTYEKIAGMRKIQPGDLLVTPNQPDDDHFTIMEAVAAKGAGDFPCYRFLPGLGGDFRHCISVNASTLRQHGYAEVHGRIRKALTTRYYRSPVQFVHDPVLIGAFERLFFGKGGPDRPAGKLPGSHGKSAMGSGDDPSLAPFEPKSDGDYSIQLRGGRRIQTRRHETLVKVAGRFLKEKCGVSVHTAHPRDLYSSRPKEIIFEAKLAPGSGTKSVREAVGQLFWYRYKFGPPDADLCVLLDRKPSQSIISFVERGLRLLIVWMDGERLVAGPRTQSILNFPSAE